MIQKNISDHVLTIGPAPDMKGGIASVLDTYFSEIFPSPKFIAETVNGNVLQRVGASAIALVRLVWRLAVDRDIRIVHLHTATKVSFPRSSLYALIAKTMGRRTILHMHGGYFADYYSRNKSWARRSLMNADCVIALSDTWRDFYRDEVGLRNVSVVPNIVPKPSEGSVQESGMVEAVFLGMICDNKGVFDLLRAISLKKAQLAGRFRLHIGGNGEVERLKSEISSLGLDDMVEFHGWVLAQDKAALLSRCRLYILPSYFEGLPISILEAMSYGHAVISTPIGGIPEVVDEENGHLVSPGDVDGLAEAVLRLVDDPGLLRSKGDASKRKVQPYFSEAVERRLTDLYTSLLKDENYHKNP